MLISALAAIAAMLSYGVGSVLQATGARAVATVERASVGDLGRVAAQPSYLLGLALDGVGFICSVIALQLLPLFLVQAILAGSVGVTAAVAALTLHVRISGRERAALGMLLVGLSALAIAAEPGHAHRPALTGALVILAGAPLCLGATALTLRRPGRQAGIVLASLAGLSFAGVGIAARVLQIRHPILSTVAEPALWALIGYGAAGLIGFAAALQRAPVTAVTAVTFVVETVIPAFVGILWLGDSTRAGLGPWLAIVGFALAVTGSVLLAGYGEVDVSSAPVPD